MKKNKIIATSLILAICVAFVLNIIYSKINNKEKICVYVAKSNMLKGEKISLDNLEKVFCTNSSLLINSNLIHNDQDISSNNLVLSENIYSGQIITEDIVCIEEKLKEKEEYVEYEYVSLPILTPADATSYLLKKGDNVNIYFTGKYSQIENVSLNTLDATYSSSKDGALVTLKLYDNIVLYGTSDATGDENSSMYTNILIRIKKDEVAKIIVLKDLGNFTITKSNY